MRRLVLRVALVWIVATSVVSRALPAAVSGQDTQHAPSQALVGVLAAAGVLTAVRAGSSASPGQDAQVLACLGQLVLPQPLTLAAAAEPGDATARQLLDRPAHAPRGPPPPA